MKRLLTITLVVSIALISSLRADQDKKKTRNGSFIGNTAKIAVGSGLLGLSYFLGNNAYKLGVATTKSTQGLRGFTNDCLNTINDTDRDIELLTKYSQTGLMALGSLLSGSLGLSLVLKGLSRIVK